MRKITTLMLAGFIVFTNLSVSTSAKVFTLSPEDILDENVSMLITVDPSQIKDPLKSYYSTYLKESMFSDVAPDSAELKMTEYLYGKVSATTKFSIAMFGQTTGAFLIEIPEIDYVNIMKKPYLNVGTSETVSGVAIYTPTDGNVSFAYIKGYLVIADSKETIGTIAKNYRKNPLSQSKDFIKIKRELSTNSAVNIFIGDIASFVDKSERKGISSMISAMDMSVEQKTDSLKFRFSVLKNSNSKTGILSLYRYMPKRDSLFFMDIITVKGLSNLIKENAEYKEFAKKSIVNMDTFLSVLEKEVALSINNNGENYPSITFLANLGSNSKNVSKEIDKLLSLLWDGLIAMADDKSTDDKLVIDDEGTKITIKRNETKVRGNTMNQYELKFSTKKSKNSDYKKLLEYLSGFTLTIGTTKDNVLLISTDKNIQSTYGEGLQNNPAIKALISNTADEIGYIDVSNINTYLQKVASSLGIEKLKTSLSNILKPWKSISFAAKSSNKITSIDYEIKVDLEQAISAITNYGKVIEKEFGAIGL